jgi:hypothetical protein
MSTATAIRHRTAGRERENVQEQDDEAPEQVKHTLQLPVRLWSQFGARARRIGVTKSEALRRALWIYVYIADVLDEEGAEIRVHRGDGTTERLVISPY